jgi:7-cyano-7-deazaguanine synthase in queuosine biosynthesis
MEEIRVHPTNNYIHLFSGGLDSTYALLKLSLLIDKEKKDRGAVYPIFIDYGHYAAGYEWNCVRRIIRFTRSRLENGKIIRDPVRICLRSDLFTWCRNVAFTGIEVGDEKCEIHNRNIVLLSVLASYLRACAENQGIQKTKFEIHTGFKQGEMPDSNRKFFDALENLLTEENGKYVIKIKLSDAIDRSKTIARLKNLLKGSQNELENILKLTTSCYSPRANGTACTKCWKCKSIAENKMRYSN